MAANNRASHTYVNPLIERYASDEMLQNFSPLQKFSIWRSLWIALAEAERELGLPITQKQINQMKKYRAKINFGVARQAEKRLRHDVMAHVHAFGRQCPDARPIIHLGATSAFVGDNTDIIVMRDGLRILIGRLANVIDSLGRFAETHSKLPTLGFTHFQPAQLTTVGKRATLWIQDLLMDLAELEHRLDTLMLRGVKGTTGTQASFLELFEGDEKKVKRLEKLLAEKFDFNKCFEVTGQTYPRKLDSQILSALSGIAQSAHKFSNDIRLLANLKEIEEPMEKEQIGSSAMAYKRNPMRCERMASLARHAIAASANPEYTAATQWLERTLDDSANRRISIPEAFLAIDAILLIYNDVASGLVVYPRVIAQRVKAELPFMATENILMAAVKKGGDRQLLHERIRKHSLASARVVKEQGKANDLVDRIKADTRFAAVADDLDDVLDPHAYVGRAPRQVTEFLRKCVAPVRKKYKSLLGQAESLKV